MTSKLAALAAAAAASMATCAGAGSPSPTTQASAPPPAPAAFASAVSRGGLVYVSATLPPDSSAAFETQAARVFEELKARLDGAGTTIDRVVSATVVLADAGDFPALNAAWNAVWPASRPTRTTIVGRLPVAGARLQVSAIAASAGTSREIIVPPGWQASALPYSPAIRAGDTLFLSGIVSRRGADNAVVTGDIETQTRTVLDHASAVLQAAGLSLSDVTAARVFLTDVGDFERMSAVYRTYFPSAPPARATVVAQLTSPDYAIEIAMVASARRPRSVHVTPNADGSPGRPSPVLSSAIEAGPTLFLSGMLGVAAGADADAATQAKETLDRLERTMKAARYGWADVVDSVVYVTDAASAGAVLEIFRQRAGGRLPVGALVVAGLVSPPARVEIMLTAGR